jgi:hypothetical protein
MSIVTWKEIKDYNNYSVSDTGFIKNNSTDRILNSCLRNGYYSITLSKNNKKKAVNIHQIVAEHFLNKPSTKCVVNHKDENKLNNNISNLEYVSYRENTMYSMTCNRTKNTDIFDLENFKQIPNYTRYMVSKNGDIYSTVIKRLCRKTILPNGSHKIKLKSDTGNYRDLYIHVIVAIVYLNYIPSKLTVISHIDAKKANNNLENLQIVTPSENALHSIQINNDRIFRRAVHYINDNQNRIEYISAKQASLETGIDNSSILKSCKYENRLAGNIKWYFTSSS